MLQRVAFSLSFPFSTLSTFAEVGFVHENYEQFHYWVAAQVQSPDAALNVRNKLNE